MVAVERVAEMAALAMATLYGRQEPAPSVAAPTTSSVISAIASSTISSIVSSDASSAPTLGTDPNNTSNSAPTPTQTGRDNGGGSNPSNSPLLFFVALGFGVVFTNLWIIVGVKYCFRYSARNRAPEEDGVAMDPLQGRPYRRRREKKLMTHDEVNEKFPMVKYKTWVADRIKDGLPSAGGVSAPPSRAASIRSASGAIVAKERTSAEERPSSSPVSKTEGDTNAAALERALKEEKNKITEKDAKAVSSPVAAGGSAPAAAAAPAAAGTSSGEQSGAVASKSSQETPAGRASADDSDDESDHINDALPADFCGTSGDTCAICIETLEDDDDVRGLTCGHAFHASCLDPWLTMRRACCPLCKADYYTPKPRPPPHDGDRSQAGRNPAEGSQAEGANAPREPRPSRRRRDRRTLRPTDVSAVENAPRPEGQGQSVFAGFFSRRPAPARQPRQTETLPGGAEPTQRVPLTYFERIMDAASRGRARPPATGSSAGGPVASGANNDPIQRTVSVTPSQLEQGNSGAAAVRS